MQAVRSKAMQAPVMSPVDASKSANRIEVKVQVARINCRKVVIWWCLFGYAAVQREWPQQEPMPIPRLFRLELARENMHRMAK